MTRAVPWRTAWDDALYGPGGFYRRGAAPAAHFRTSVHASALFAQAVLRLVRLAGLDTVVDVGAGGGELLIGLATLAPDLALYGVDLGPRPPDVPAAVHWTDTVPRVDGLLLANEWLDNVPCDVVERTPDGLRQVLVDQLTGDESLGGPPAAENAAWLERWWLLEEPGQRAEVGRTRDAAWADAVGRVGRGLAIAIDYGHGRDSRPLEGTLLGYRNGRAVRPVPDGSCDITAHVALDACASAAPGSLVVTQRTALRALGVGGQRPPYERAAIDPAGYVTALQDSSQAGELTDPGGLGGFGWLVQPIGLPMPKVFTTAPGASAARG